MYWFEADFFLRAAGQSRAAAQRCALSSKHPSTGTQLPVQPAELFLTVSAQKSIHASTHASSFTHFTWHQSGLTSCRFGMTYCRCSRTSLHLNIWGGRGYSRGGKKLLAVADISILYEIRETHACSLSIEIISKRNVYFQFMRKSLWDRRQSDRRPAFAL